MMVRVVRQTRGGLRWRERRSNFVIAYEPVGDRHGGLLRTVRRGGRGDRPP